MNARLPLWLILLPIVTSSAWAGEVPKPDIDGYRKTVAPLLAKYCIDCHGPDDPEGNLSLDSIDPNLLAGDQLETWRMVDEQVRFGDMPPQDADQPAAAERGTILMWIRGELLKTQRPGVVTDEKLLLPQFGNYVDHQFLFGERLPRVVPAPPRIWRLRPAIYERQLPAVHKGGRIDGLANGLNVFDGPDFKDYAASYFVDEAATAPLLGNAKKIAAALVGPQSRNTFCKQLAEDNGPPSAEVVAGAVESVFFDALGRHPTAEEKKRFQEFHQKASAIGGYKPAGKALVAAILMQPEVLYRQELGDGRPDEFGRVRLTQQEIAYALSYALADAPIESFVAAAAAGQLATGADVAAVVQAQVDKGTNPRIMEFFREYFNYGFATEVFKDAPEGGEHDAAMLVGDLEMTIRDVLRDDRQVLARLLTQRKFYVNTSYGREKEAGKLVPRNSKTRKYQTAFSLPIDWKWSAHLQPVEFPEGERAGVLTHPAWLTAWSGNFENHPVQRGKWIRTHLLGGTVPDVPIGVDARVPEKEHTTFRDRLKIATSAAECWRCHRKMDPLGVVFERYDHYGRYQRKDAGQPVDASGEITRTGVPELDGRSVNGPAELMEILAKSEHVEQVFVRHAFRFFLGRNETLGDANTLQDAHTAYRNSDGSFNAIVVSLLSSDSFLLRQQPSN